MYHSNEPNKPACARALLRITGFVSTASSRRRPSDDNAAKWHVDAYSMDLRSYPFTVEKNTFPRSRIRRANRELRQGRWSLPGCWPVIRRVKAYFRALSFLAASRLGNNEFSNTRRYSLDFRIRCDNISDQKFLDAKACASNPSFFE